VTVKVALAGSTGSIGRQTLEVVGASSGRYDIVSLAASSNEAVLREQIAQHRPGVVAVVDESVRKRLAADFPAVKFSDDVADVVHDADVVVNAVVGFAGLPVTLNAAKWQTVGAGQQGKFDRCRTNRAAAAQHQGGGNRPGG